MVVYLLSAWLLHARHKPHIGVMRALVPVVCVLILASSWLPQTALLTGLLMAAMIALATVVRAPLEA